MVGPEPAASIATSGSSRAPRSGSTDRSGRRGPHRRPRHPGRRLPRNRLGRCRSRRAPATSDGGSAGTHRDQPLDRRPHSAFPACTCTPGATVVAARRVLRPSMNGRRAGLGRLAVVDRRPCRSDPRAQNSAGSRQSPICLLPDGTCHYPSPRLLSTARGN